MPQWRSQSPCLQAKCLPSRFLLEFNLYIEEQPLRMTIVGDVPRIGQPIV